jgi:hypothetical protein
VGAAAKSDEDLISRSCHSACQQALGAGSEKKGRCVHWRLLASGQEFDFTDARAHAAGPRAPSSRTRSRASVPPFNQKYTHKL